MISNTGTHSGLETLRANRRHEMDAFDQLDPRLREFIRNLPMNFAAYEALEMQRIFGVEETLRTGHNMLEINFPGWTPI